MFRFSIISALFLTTFSMNANAATFRAYNDLASNVPNEYAGTNVTDYSLGTTSAPLIDYATGTQLGYTLSVTGDGTNANVSGTNSNGFNPNSGTDAYSVFGDNVNMVRYIQGDGGAGFVNLEFDNLTTTELYEVVVYGERSPATDGRPTQFTIFGADSFMNESTSGTDFTGSSDPSVSYDTAPNFDVGYVARFTDINPGSDGSFFIQVDDATPADGQNWYVNAVSISSTEEVPSVPEPTSFLALTMVGASLFLSKQVKRG